MSLTRSLIYKSVIPKMNWRFGPLGPITDITGHWSAGPPDRSDKHAMELVRSFNAEHKERFGDGLGYHFNITRKGNIILGRPIYYKGAHVGGWNTGNIGVLFHGGPGGPRRPSLRQRRAYQRLRRKGHTTWMPATHRFPKSLARTRRRGHNDWPGHETNSCPGIFRELIRRGF